MSSPGIDWESHAAAYADKLVTAGAIRDPAWRKVFTIVPRHEFVPRYWALNEFNVPATLVDGANPDQRESWLDAVYSDQVLVTQWAPSMLGGTPVRVVTSSASQPSVVAVMLDRLNVQDGHKVLEIGTGTGYNAALLCQRLGDEQVASIDIDPALIEHATTHLATAGHHPHLAAGDCAAGLPDAGPFDRIIATCAIPRIPTAWIDQLAPGGRLVAPLTFGGALAVLDKTRPTQLSGHIDAYATYFMPLRTTARRPTPDGFIPDLPEQAATGQSFSGYTDIDPARVTDPDFLLWLSLHLPGVHLTPSHDQDLQLTAVTIYATGQRATATCQPGSEGRWPVTQQGRRLWDTVETAWRTFHRAGHPNRTRLGITATTDGQQYIWLDHPGSGHTWPVPADS